MRSRRTPYAVSASSALTNDELHAIFRECDPNGDGFVTLSEFLRVRRGGLKKTKQSFAAPPMAAPEAPPTLLRPACRAFLR